MTPKTYRFLVAVVPVVPGPASGGVSYTFQQNTVRVVTAESAKAAAEMVGVPGGAVAHVAKLAHVSKFKRPEKAELEAA